MEHSGQNIGPLGKHYHSKNGDKLCLMCFEVFSIHSVFECVLQLCVTLFTFISMFFKVKPDIVYTSDPSLFNFLI